MYHVSGNHTFLLFSLVRKYNLVIHNTLTVLYRGFSSSLSKQSDEGEIVAPCHNITGTGCGRRGRIYKGYRQHIGTQNVYYKDLNTYDSRATREGREDCRVKNWLQNKQGHEDERNMHTETRCNTNTKGNTKGDTTKNKDTKEDHNQQTTLRKMRRIMKNTHEATERSKEHTRGRGEHTHEHNCT